MIQWKVRFLLYLVNEMCAKIIFNDYTLLLFLHKQFVLHIKIGENYDKRRSFAESKRLL